MTTEIIRAEGSYRQGLRPGDRTYVIGFRKETSWMRLEERLVTLAMDAAIKVAMYPPNEIGRALWEVATAPLAGPVNRAYTAIEGKTVSALGELWKGYERKIERSLELGGYQSLGQL